MIADDSRILSIIKASAGIFQTIRKCSGVPFMENKRKETTLIILISVALIGVLVALAVFLIPKLFPEKSDFPADDLSGVKYVSNSGLDYGESSSLVLGKYSVKREGSSPKAGNLVIKCATDKTEEKDYITYWVFDSAKDAKKCYQNEYDFVIEYYNERGQKGKDNILGEGSNWFEANMPANDAEIHHFYYLIDNVILMAETDYISYMTTVETTRSEEEQTDSEPTPTSKISKRALSGYIKDHAEELRRFVLTEICPNIKKRT